MSKLYKVNYLTDSYIFTSPDINEVYDTVRNYYGSEFFVDQLHIDEYVDSDDVCLEVAEHIFETRSAADWVENFNLTSCLWASVN